MKKTLTAFFAGLMLVSCVSTPAQKAPEWIMGAPRPDAKYTYFTAESTDAAGDRAKAQDAAVGTIISTIVKYLGVEVKAEFEGEVQATLNSYAATMKQNVTLSADARFAGFSVAETFFAPSKDKKSKAVTAYVLAKYETSEMEKERKRLQDLIDEQNNLVLVPERDGTAALGAGRSLEAAQLFLQAAAGAASIDIDNKEIKVQRNLNKALNALIPLRIVPVSAPAQAGLNQELAEPFVVKLVNGENAGSPGAPAVRLDASYQRKQASGRLSSKTESVVTDSSGQASFKPPAYDYVGSTKVSFKVDGSALRDSLDRIPAAFSEQVEAIARELSGKEAEFTLTVGSDARATPLHIAIVDLDESGAVAGNAAQRAVLDSLIKEKFKAQAVALDAQALKAGDAQTLLAGAKAASAQRLVYGTAAVSGVKKDGGAYVATCKIILSVLDIASGGVIASSEKSANAIGSTEADARAASWKAAGAAAVKDLMGKLP